jgi:2,3-dihydroxybenzoate decarboxylase
MALAIEGNNWVYNEIKDLGSRFSAFAAVPMHNGEDASKELRRAVTELGMIGAMLNDWQDVHPDAPSASIAENAYPGEEMKRLYYDDPSFDPFWATCVELNVPVYMCV